MAIQQILLATAIAGAGGGSSGATLNPLDKHADIVLSGGNLTATKTTTGSWRVARATNPKTSGKRYFELKYEAGTADGLQLGIALGSNSLANYLGSEAGSAGFIGANATRQLYANGSLVQNNGAGVGLNGYMGIAVDIDAGKGWARTSNLAGWIGGGDPSLGTSPSFTFTPGATVYAAVSLHYSNNQVTINLGGAAFNMAAPVAYTSWDGSGAVSYTDTFWPQTVLLIPFTGADASTVCTDLTGRHTGFTFNGNAQIDTSDSDFSSGALQLDGVSDGVAITDNLTDFVFPGDCTFELWYKAVNFAQFSSFFADYAGSGGGIRFGVESGGGALNMRNGDGGSNVHSRSVTVSTGVAHHAAFVRNGSDSRIFHDGVKAGADITGWTPSLGLSTYNFVIGNLGPVYPNDDEFYGWISYVRLTHAARYWANFTPPATPFPTV